VAAVWRPRATGRRREFRRTGSLRTRRERLHAMRSSIGTPRCWTA